MDQMRAGLLLIQSPLRAQGKPLMLRVIPFHPIRFRMSEKMGADGVRRLFAV